MSIKQIETLVFDYGGVIVNIDDASVVKAMESLGVTAFMRLIHVRKIKRLMHQYIKVHPTFRVMRQSRKTYSLSLKYSSSLKLYALRFMTLILLFIPSTLPVDI